MGENIALLLIVQIDGFNLWNDLNHELLVTLTFERKDKEVGALNYTFEVMGFQKMEMQKIGCRRQISQAMDYKQHNRRQRKIDFSVQEKASIDKIIGYSGQYGPKCFECPGLNNPLGTTGRGLDGFKTALLGSRNFLILGRIFTKIGPASACFQDFLACTLPHCHKTWSLGNNIPGDLNIGQRQHKILTTKF